MTRLLAFLMVAGLLSDAGAQLLPDDHGNTLADATMLPGRSNTVSAVLNYDTDVDVFSASFLPGRSYLFTVQTGTVWDVALDLIPPDLSATALETSTVWKTTALATGWTNTGAASRWYLSLSAAFAYTTGSYQLVVAEAPGLDTDGDGLGDSWEQSHFLNLSSANATSDVNADGFPDLKAYMAGLAPTQALAWTSVVRAQEADAVSWTLAPHATYDLYASTNIAGPWAYLHRHVAGSSGGTMVWTNPTASASRRFYRLEFLY